MSGWYLTTKQGNEEAVTERMEAARTGFLKQGLSGAKLFESPHHRLLHVDSVYGGPACYFSRGADWIVVAGTFVYRGSTGEAALRLALDQFDPANCRDSVMGQFGLVMCRDGLVHVLTDSFGAFQLFHDAEHSTIASSFLLLCNESNRLTFHPQGLYEYVFNCFPLGDDTVFDEIKRIGPERRLELREKVCSVLMQRPELPITIDTRPSEELVKDHAEGLVMLVQNFLSAWKAPIGCPLSGGLDSRLVLALLRECGVTPHVYVYGAQSSPDVCIAQAVGKALGFPVETLDMGALVAVGNEDYEAKVERSFHECDALVLDSELFDRGQGSTVRLARQADGRLAVSGSCGEIFRNFFYLPDRRMMREDVIASFFSRYDRRDLTARFDETSYLRTLGEKAGIALGKDREWLTRIEVEALYSRLRCRAFVGRDASLVNRTGRYFVPFFEPAVVNRALTLPLELKRAGEFEARVLAHVSPELAGLPSAYGHDFATPPSMRHRLSEWATVVRPPALRRRSYTLKNRLGRLSDEQGSPWEPSRVAFVVDTSYPVMQHYFNMESLRDPNQIRRIAALEYLAQHYGSDRVQHR